MNKEKIQIGNKFVWPSDPYQPIQNYINDFVGRDEEMKLIIAAWMSGRHSLPMAPLLEGEAGVGKNRIVYEVAKKTGRDLYIFQGHEDVTAEDLACAVRFSDTADSKMDYIISPILTAMLKGAICFIDEIGKIRPRALALLVSLLDERRYMDSTLLAERINAHKNFRFIAATNSGEINTLPEFIRSRMRPIVKVGYPPRNEIDQMIFHRFPGIQNNMDELLNAFWMLWEKNTDTNQPPSPRDAIHLFGLAISIRDFEESNNNDAEAVASSKERIFQLEINRNNSILEARHIEKAFDKLFSQESQET